MVHSLSRGTVLRIVNEVEGFTHDELSPLPFEGLLDGLATALDGHDVDESLVGFAVHCRQQDVVVLRIFATRSTEEARAVIAELLARKVVRS